MAHPADSADPRWSVFMRNSTVILPWIGLENRRHISMGFPPDVWPNVVNLACNAPHDAIVPVRVSKRGGGGVDDWFRTQSSSFIALWLMNNHRKRCNDGKRPFTFSSLFQAKTIQRNGSAKEKKRKMQSFFLNGQDCSKKKTFSMHFTGADRFFRRRRVPSTATPKTSSDRN